MRNVTLSVWPHKKSCSIYVRFVVSGADRVDASTCPYFQAPEYVCFFGGAPGFLRAPKMRQQDLIFSLWSSFGSSCAHLSFGV